MIVGACGYGDCSCARGPVTPTPKLAEGFDVLVTERDQDVTVHAGQKIEIYLRQRTGMTMWSNVRSDDEAVLAPIPTGLLAPRGVTLTAFEAVTAGTASITATAGAACSPGQACPMYAVLFSVRVTVV